MKLHVGERLIGRPNQPGGYVVTGVVRETPFGCLYTGKKIFANFDFAGKRPREADEKEWLDVFLRTLEYPELNDPDYVATRRRLARHEMRRVLGNRATNLWPEPVDVLEVGNTRDAFTGQSAEELSREPVLVFARPQGETLTEWRERGPALSRVLAVLAELLDLVDTAHREGLLLSGISPESVVVDRADRIHYLATDLILEARPVPDLPCANRRGRYFLPERFPREFAAPECFEPTAALDCRADLFAWATLTLHLLTGEWPEHGSPPYRREHLTHLESILRGVPPAQVRTWLESLGAPDALRDWPHNLLTALRLCLEIAPKNRPDSVERLRQYLTMPPAPPVVAALAVRTPVGQPLRIHIDTGALNARYAIVVRRAPGAAPQSATDGEPAGEGPPGPWIDIVPGTGDTDHYSVFTRIDQTPNASASPAVPVEVLEPTPVAVRQFAERIAAAGALARPPEISLLFAAVDANVVAEALFDSKLPTVRGWAIEHLARRREAQPNWADKLLWRVLKDQAPALRLRSAALLLAGRPTADQVRPVVELLGESTDERLQALQELRQLEVRDDVLRPVINELEDRRPAKCHECGQALLQADRAAHLMKAHGYVYLFGVLWPRATALARLWEQIFAEGDSSWADELAHILSQGAPEAERAHRLVEALEVEWCRRSGPGVTPSPDQKAGFVRCLRSSVAWRPCFRPLLHSADPGVRAFGRELLLPDLLVTLSGGIVTAAEVRQHLDRACADGPVEEKLLLCERLVQAGVYVTAVRACAEQLELEKVIECPACRIAVVAAELEAHLRQAHGLYQFRGMRRSLDDTFQALVACVCSPSPDYPAWKMLVNLAQETLGARSEQQLAEWVTLGLGKLSKDNRHAAIRAVAEAVAAAGTGPRLVPHVVRQIPSAKRHVAWHLALEIVARVPPPVTAALLQAVRPLLGNRRTPPEARAAAAASLLRTTGRDDAASRDLLDAYVARTSTKRALARLDRLEDRVGRVPALETLRDELESRLRMHCPRCGIEMRRRPMEEHLWHAHRLVREGRRVREPWRLIEDWVADYRLEKDPEVLNRCRELAGRLAGERGTVRLGRMLLREGVDEADTRQLLLAAALRKRGTLCPHCYTVIRLPPPPAVAPLEVNGGCLEGAGHCVRLSDRRLRPRLDIVTPLGDLFSGKEPGGKLTNTGRAALLIGTPLLVAGLCSIAALFLEGWPLASAALALGGTLVMAGYVCLGWRADPTLPGRAIHYAWTMLVPRILSRRSEIEGGSAGALAFVGGLARLSIGAARPEDRAEPLRQALDRTEALRDIEPNAVPALAELWRLAAEDRGQRGEDPVWPVAEQVGRALAGELPLSFAGPLLEKFSSPWWTSVSMARFRVLVCERAFLAGYEVGDLLRAGRAFPPLGTALKLDPPSLAQLRLLWTLRTSRPWERIGGALTVFELAAERRRGSALADFPDLLLVDERKDIFLCGRGVVFQGGVIGRMPESIAVRENREFQDGGFDLMVGTLRFHFPTSPDALATRLERWLRFYFTEFVQQASAQQARRSGQVPALLGPANRVICPECRQPCLPQFAEVGVPVRDQLAGRSAELPARAPA
jgi:hypothetical protein